MQNTNKVAKMPSTSTSKRDFQNDIIKVRITLPVNFDISESPKIVIALFPKIGSDCINFVFDYLPNVDINCYIQFAIQQFQHGGGITFDSSKSDKSL